MFFPKLNDLKLTNAVRAFYRSALYPFVIAALMALAEIFAMEIAVYYLYLILATVGLFFCEDALCILPMACCGYMTFAYKNNPGKFPETTAFSRRENLIQLFVIVALGAVLLIGRLVTFLITHPTRRVPALSLGFLLLGIAYLLGGVGTEGYVFAKDFPYALVQILSLCFFYFYFYYSVDWEKVKKSYIFVVFLAIGVGMLAEIGAMYAHEGVFRQLENGRWEVNRGALGTGWGVYNNVGCIMAMCVPAPFYFAAKNDKWGWAFTLLGCVFMLGVAFTQSRGSILFGAVVFVMCVVALLIKSKGKNRIRNLVIFAALLIGLAIGLAFFRDRLSALFSAFKTGLDDSDRFNLYRGCVENLKSSPLVGVGFQNSAGYSIHPGTFTPRRAHNTVFQLVASGGELALLAYLFHRMQTLWLWLKKPNFEKTMAAFIIAALILTSIVDCNFFNIGPGLLYGCVLVYMERCANAEAEKGIEN